MLLRQTLLFLPAQIFGPLSQMSPAEILEDVVWRHRARKVAPKTVKQKH